MNQIPNSKLQVQKLQAQESLNYRLQERLNDFGLTLHNTHDFGVNTLKLEK